MWRKDRRPTKSHSLSLRLIVVLVVIFPIFKTFLILKNFISSDNASSFVEEEVFRNRFERKLPLEKSIEYKNPFPKWCADADCKDGFFCRTCDRRFLIIIAQGRSGSTTIKNMINLLPGVRLRGELGKDDAFSAMLNYFNRIGKQGVPMKQSHGHFNYIERSISCSAQHMMEVLNPPYSRNRDDSSTIIGFKEIRFLTESQIKFFLFHFPCFRFIFSVRKNEKATVQSQNNRLASKKINPTTIDIVSKQKALYAKFYEMLGPQKAYWMQLEDWSTAGGSQYFSDLSKWLGFQDCHYSGLLHDHKNGTMNLDFRRKIKVNEACRYVE